MKRTIIIGLVLLAGLIAWRLLAGGRDTGSSYRFVEIQRGDVEATISSTGILQAITTVEVGTQVSGQIADIYVDFNDRVHKDQLIARIDPTILQQEVRSAETSVERSQAEFDQARRDLARIERLYKGQVATESEYSDAQYKYAVAEAALKAANISLERAQRNLSYTEIRAPIDGVVLDRKVDVGQTVAASLSAPQLFMIAEDLSQMEILAAVDESDIGQVHQGQAVHFTVQAYPDQSFQGTVGQVRLQSTIQENVVNYTVVVAVPNPDGRLLPGMTATVDFIIDRAADTLMVSNAALRFRATEEMRQQLREQREATAARADGRAGTGPGGSGETGENARRRPDGPDRMGQSGAQGRGLPANRAFLWYLDEDGKLNATVVQTGITDGQNTVVAGPHIRQGMQVIAAVTSAAVAEGINPFQGQQPQRRRGPPTGM
jgi:HlyD family secretion protein